MSKSVTAAIAAQNTFTDPIRIQEHGTIRISGTFTATVSLQRSEDGVTWHDTGDTWTAAGVHSFSDYTKMLYRAGVKTSGYTTGTVSLWLGSGSAAS